MGDGGKVKDIVVGGESWVFAQSWRQGLWCTVSRVSLYRNCVRANMCQHVQ